MHGSEVGGRAPDCAEAEHINTNLRFGAPRANDRVPGNGGRSSSAPPLLQRCRCAGTLSRQLWKPWGWKQANGALRDMVCRGLLLMLERAGEIELPPVRWRIVGQRRTARPRPAAVLIDTTPLTMPLGALGP